MKAVLSSLALVLSAGIAMADIAQRAALVDLIRDWDCYVEVAALDAFLTAAHDEIGLGISALMAEVQVLMEEGVAIEKPSGDLRLSKAACAEGYNQS